MGPGTTNTDEGLCLKSRESHLDRVSTGSGSDLVKSWESTIVRKCRMLITDQVATAPCTDPVQAHLLTFRAKLPQIDKTLATVRGDKEHYVKKAIEWLQRMATRHRQSLPRKVRKAED